MTEQLTLFAADTHASHFPPPGSEEARKMTAISGRNLVGSWLNSGPLGSLEKTLLGTSAWASTTCFLTWKDKATPAGRLLFQLAPLGRSIVETDVGLWPTPRSCSAMAANITTSAIQKAPERFKTFPNLETAMAIKMWPTPTSRDHKDTGDCANVPINGLLGRSVGPSRANGSLNPTWVEWLMGFPEGWTDLKPSEMP